MLAAWTSEVRRQLTGGSLHLQEARGPYAEVFKGRMDARGGARRAGRCRASRWPRGRASGSSDGSGLGGSFARRDCSTARRSAPVLKFIALQDDILRRAVAAFNGKNWKKIGEALEA